jgi:hypothetical protein
MRDRAVQQVSAAREKYAADFARLATDSPIWAWVPFLNSPDQTRLNAVLDRIRTLERRQSDAELMLERGDFPLGYLGRFDLMPTRSICDKARALLRRQIAPLVLKTPNAKRYAESPAWETMEKAYRDTNYDIHELAALRDPKKFGADPARASCALLRAHAESASQGLALLRRQKGIARAGTGRCAPA